MKSRYARTVCTVALLALSCAACVAPPPPPAIGPGLLPDRRPTPPPDPRATQVARVDSAVRGIRDNHVVVVEENALYRACWEGLLAFAAAAGRGVDAVAEPRRANVIALLAELHDPDPERTDDAADACLRRMVERDGMGSLIDTKTMREMMSNVPRGAVGLEITLAPQGAAIVAVLAGGPAAAAGLGAGDLLVAIDDTPVAGKPLVEIRRLLRGATDSKIAVAVRRQGRAETDRLVLTRQVVEQVPVVARLLQPGIAVAVVGEFGETTPRLLREAMVRLRKENDAPLKGIVLDLRLSTGGLLDSSVAIAAAFLPRDAIVAELKGRVDMSNRPLRARPSDYGRNDVDVLAGLPEEARTVPVAVLIGPVTASGAEIVAGALRAQGRARLFGARTYGLGTIDTLLPLRGRGAIRLVTANVQLPDGRTFHRTGLEPDQGIAAGATPMPQQRRTLDPATMPDADDPAVRAALAWLASRA